MPTPHQEEFRVIGQWLDHQQAEEIELLYATEVVTVRWRAGGTRPDVRSFTFPELRALSERARRLRRNPFGQMTGGWAVALRTLGQELDSEAIEPLLVRPVAGGLQVYGERHGQPYPHWFALERLEDWNRVHRTQRMIRLLRSRRPTAFRWLGRLHPARWGRPAFGATTPHGDGHQETVSSPVGLAKNSSFNVHPLSPPPGGRSPSTIQFA